MFKVKIIILLTIFVSITFYFYGNSILEFAMRPGPNKKIKYKLDLSRIQKLKKGALTKEVIEKILVEYYEKNFDTELRQDGTINYRGYHKPVSMHIYYDESEEGALFFYRYSVAPMENRLYDYKGENLQYYATYMFQNRSSLWGLYRLLDKYVTFVEIQNNNVYMSIMDYSKNKDKKELQEVIDLIADTAEKHSNKE